MSLFSNNAGGSGGFGAFGAANNNNQQAGNPSVFGSGGAFGQPAAAAPGFGANNNAASSPFGAAKPAFGATNTPATGGIFGNAAANTNTGGGFGFGANQQQQPSNAFGNNAATTGGLFGGSKPAFGTATTTAGTAGGLFGATAGATGGGVFGNAGTNTGLGFGASGNQALVNGTTNPPYQAFTEKEAQGNTTNHFQTIAFMPAYAKYSLEELRLQDYAQGRRYGNDSGSGGGGFGGTGFGGTFANNTNTGAFGATNNTATGGGLFGNNNTNTTTTPFGAQPTNNAFGASNTAASGGLFGAKPAAPSLFSGAATTTTGGGLFGANNNTGNTGAFGNNAATTGFGTNTNTGGGLFGNQANQNNQQKPFAFSNTTTPGFGAAANTGGAFGANNTGGGLFGNNQNQQQPATNTFGGQQPNNTFGAGAAGAFGNTPAQNQPATGFGGFGQQPQQQQQKPAFGGGFGTTQAPNNTTAQGGLFGNNQAQNAGGLFSNQSKPFGATTTTTQPTGGGLFGSNPTPQANTGGLFGNNQPAGNTGGGLFGNQQNTGATGGLFGNNNAPKPAIGSGLFGNNTQTSTQNTNNGLFSGLNTTLNTTPGSLFNNNQQQQPQQQQMNNSLFSSAFGAGQQGQQQQQLQGQFTTSINDSPYGLSMMSSMNNFQAAPVGPIASPLSSSIQTKKAALIPHYKIAPRQPSLAPRLGGSFSRSGSPFATSTSGNTASSTGTSLSRSFSSSNKLHLFDSDDSVLSSGSFTPGSGARVASLKKLVIDKKIRDQDLFSGGQDLRKESANNEVMKGNGTKSILKKTVSFDVATSKGTNADFFSANGQPSRETTGPTPSAEEMGFLRSPSRRSIDGLSNGASSSSAPEAQPESSTALAVVEKPAEDKSHGSYWMVPSAQKLKGMTKEQQTKVIGLTIGRRGYGKIRFDNPVDITDLDPEEIPGKIVVFDLRVCTVYPVGVMDKAPPGYGLNVPATITLEDCYPISKDERGKIKDPEHPRYSSHIRRLQNIKDTEFVDYLADEGIWIFKVQHFTTYGLVDSDDDEGDEGDITYDESILRERKAAEKATEDLTPTRSTASSYFDREDSMDASDADASGMDTGVFDDTFDFKRLSNGRNARNDGFPTSFLGGDETEATFDTYDEEEEEEEADTTMAGESFLGEGSVGSVEEEDEPAEPASEEEYLEDETAQDLTVVYEEDEEDATVGYTNPAESSMIESATKEVDFHSNQRALPLGNDWTEQLNATISPVKKRFGGTNFFSPSKTERTSPVKKLQPLNYGVLDLANDLYGGSSDINGGTKKENGVFSRAWDKIESPKSSRYQQNRSSTAKRLDLEDENALDRSWRKAVRPAWGHDGTLIFVGELEGLRQTRRKGGDTDLKAARLKFPVQDSESQVAPKPLELQFRASTIKLDEYGVPVAVLDDRTLFHHFTELPWAQDAASQHEKSVWALASVLWDPIDDANPDGENDHRLNYMREKRRKEKLSKFLEELVEADADDHAHKASTLEETAFAHLTAHRVEQACAALLEAGDFRLATLLPMVGGDAISRELIKKQINEWRKKGVLAEIPIAIRALYELLSGNTCFSEGVKAPQEDAAQEFFLTQKFGLDWKRGFALKLWYGCAEEDGIGSAVSAYEREMNQWPGNVPAPLPWYHSISQSDNYDILDILWGLLKIYADTKFNLEDALSPKSIAFSNLNYRLSWQLRTIFARKGIRDFDGGKVQFLDDGSEEYAPGPIADQVTIDFAGGLEIGGLWEWAIFVLLHLIDTDSRETAIRNVLGRHLDELVEVEGPEVAKKLDFLEKNLLIPQKWIFEARALKARHSGEHLIEAEYLLSAQAWNEAHKTVIEQVAPEAIISGDLEQLKAILAKFEDVNLVKTWGLGGQVYLDYITLVEFVQGGGSTSRPVVIKTEQKGLPAKSGITDVAKRLLVSLGSADRKLFLQNVAIREMAGVVGSWVLKSDDEPESRILQGEVAEGSLSGRAMWAGLVGFVYLFSFLKDGVSCSGCG
ncbi:uncharacterized protein LAJ45_06572 [Morchella importuna]|uniref:uncharacterized protein n=1 Tax=Morchella importuna TaxID=1174673 RepID=UPI001E8CF13D|nr:uncharacterized protein LAJ45_06572 [Morchella importuna]KAH8149492.1 hypothetical protein LAJ45_06572 [Morchella importuna]